MSKEKDFFADQILHKFYSHPEVLANFELLQNIGVMDFFELLITTYKDLELLHQKATYIFMQDNLDSLYHFITEAILQKFIPSYLLFVVRQDRFSEYPMVNCFKNLKRVDSPIHVEDLTPYAHFFENNNQMLVFENDSEFAQADPVFVDLANFSPRLLLPIMGKGSFYGFVLVGKKLLDEVYSEAERNFIQTIVQFAAIAIQNIINHRWAVTDAKTGLYCFNFFKDRMIQEISRTCRHHHETALLIIDIDHFKEFNDNHGHQAGDAMILTFSNLLKKVTRVDDILCRFGGDEFMILLADTDVASISAFAQRLMKAASDIHFDIEGRDIPPITVSIGISVYQEGSRVSADDFIKQADKALYHSKHNGRNRMTFWGPNNLFVSKPCPAKSSPPPSSAQTSVITDSKSMPLNLDPLEEERQEENPKLGGSKGGILARASRFCYNEKNDSCDQLD